jgi:hypothetical protein
VNLRPAHAVKETDMKAEKKFFVVTYSHEFGTDVWLVKSHKKPTVKQVIKSGNLDFEEEKGEVIGIYGFPQELRVCEI